MKFGHHMLWKGRAFWLLLNQFNRYENFSGSVEPSGCGERGQSEGKDPAEIHSNTRKLMCQSYLCEFFLFPAKITPCCVVSLGERRQKLKTASQKSPSGFALGLPLPLLMAGGITDTGELYSPYVSPTDCGFGHKFGFFFKIVFPQHCVCKFYFLMDITSAFQEIMEVKGWLNMLNFCSYMGSSDRSQIIFHKGMMCT